MLCEDYLITEPYLNVKKDVLRRGSIPMRRMRPGVRSGTTGRVLYKALEDKALEEKGRFQGTYRSRLRLRELRADPYHLLGTIRRLSKPETSLQKQARINFFLNQDSGR